MLNNGMRFRWAVKEAVDNGREADVPDWSGQTSQACQDPGLNRGTRREVSLPSAHACCPRTRTVISGCKARTLSDHHNEGTTAVQQRRDVKRRCDWNVDSGGDYDYDTCWL